MSLSEEQIALFGRQILVKGIGGRGQEALCSATARVTGSRIAATYLAAGGTFEGDDGALAVGVEGFAWQVGGCATCHALTAQNLTPTEDVEQGALAALMFQRAVLGLVAREAAVGVTRVPCCREHA